ncbi:histamine N-methyltransferase-like [Rhopilema esculentum]|uniref:histamine N-methyltransferase-like n=1 Tax=Rhopilema esculentum TaxID=499914 RepID=UPI0031CFE7CE|eukprot:gene11873-2423_t
MPLSQEYTDFFNSYQSYNDIIKVWHRGFDNQNKAWIRDQLMPVLIPKLNLEDRDLHELKVLSVGSGNGSFDLLLIDAILKEIKSQYPGTTMSWTVVEPNSVSVQEFQRKAQSTEDYCGNVKFVWETAMFQDFVARQQGIEEPQKYHLITFINSLYYVDERLALRQSYNLLLEDQGVVLTVKEEENSTTQKAFRMYVQLMGQTSRGLTPTNEILTELQKELGIAYDRFTAPLNVEITEIFQDDNPVGGALIKFLLHSNEDPRKSKEGVKVLEFLKSECRSTCDAKGEHLCIAKKQEVTLIMKAL